MDELQQVHGVAAMLVQKHGIRAISVAEHNALKAQRGGDIASANGWRSVAKAVASLLKGDGTDS
jgi:hypothetical protein